MERLFAERPPVRLVAKHLRKLAEGHKGSLWKRCPISIWRSYVRSRGACGFDDVSSVPHRRVTFVGSPRQVMTTLSRSGQHEMTKPIGRWAKTRAQGQNSHRAVWATFSGGSRNGPQVQAEKSPALLASTTNRKWACVSSCSAGCRPLACRSKSISRSCDSGGCDLPTRVSGHANMNLELRQGRNPAQHGQSPERQKN